MSQFAKKRLFQTEDRSKLVHEDHPEARFLYAAEGDEIPDSACERYGIEDGDLTDAKPATAKKSGKPAANKAAPAGDDKAVPAVDDKAAPAVDDKAVPARDDKADA